MLRFRQEYALSLDVLADIRQQISHLIRLLGGQKTLLEQVQLAISEHLSNLIKHADGEGHTVVLALYAHQQVGKLVIKDKLKGFEQFETLANQDLLASDELCESGMGLKLLGYYFPELSYQVCRYHNSLSLPFAILKQTRARILLVDDDVSTAALYAKYLEQDYDIETCHSTQAAFEKLKRDSYQLVVADVHMPGVDGLGFKEKLQTIDDCRYMPFVFLSGDDSFEVLDSAAALSIDDYLIKPVKKGQLLNVCHRVLNRWRPLKGKTHSWLSQLPQRAAGFSFQGFHHSADQHSGDFFFIRQQGEVSCFIFGDIMGHGEDAYLNRQVINGFIQGFWLNQLPTSPADILNALSRVMAEQKILVDSYLTCVCVCIGPNGVSMANAGHPAPLGLASTGWEPLIKPEPLLGLMPTLEYKEQVYALHSFHGFLFYSDGWIENTERQQDVACAAIERVQGVTSQEDAAEQLWLSHLPSGQTLDDMSVLTLWLEQASDD